MRRDCSVCQGRLLFHPQVLRVNAQFRYDFLLYSQTEFSIVLNPNLFLL